MFSGQEILTEIIDLSQVSRWADGLLNPDVDTHHGSPPLGASRAIDRDARRDVDLECR